MASMAMATSPITSIQEAEEALRLQREAEEAEAKKEADEARKALEEAEMERRKAEEAGPRGPLPPRGRWVVTGSLDSLGKTC